MSNNLDNYSEQDLQERAERWSNVGITFTSQNVFGEEMTLGGVIRLISPLNRESALLLLSSLNIHCTLVDFITKDSWRGAGQHVDSIVNQFLAPSSRLNARLVANDERFVSPISEISLLTLAGLVCVYSQRDGGVTSDVQSAQRDLFRALLGIQWGITGKRPDTWEKCEYFPRWTQLVWRNICLQNFLGSDLARLRAYLTVPEVSTGLGFPIERWFKERLGVEAEDFEAIANSLFGMGTHRVGFAELFARFPAVAERMSPLLNMVCTTADFVEREGRKLFHLEATHEDAINESQKLADIFFRFPFVRIGANPVCISSRLLFNRLHRSLHYLVTEPVLGNRALIEQIRGECGKLFEGYIHWLFKSFFQQTDVRVIRSYRISDGRPVSRGQEPPERDIALLAGGGVWTFEIKTAVPSIQNRRRCAVEDFVGADGQDGLFNEAVEQAITAADAWLEGRVFEDAALSKPLPRATKVVPCVVVFEPLPLRFPVALEFEDALSQKLQSQPFAMRSNRFPVQLFDIEAVENFGGQFALPLEWKLLLDTLEKRALSPELRYRKLSREGTPPDGEHSGSELLPKLLIDAEESSKKRWHFLTKQPDTANG